MTKSEIVEQVNELIHRRDVIGRRMHEIRANDPLFSHPIVSVALDNPESCERNQTIRFVDVNGFSAVAHSFFDGRKELFSMLIG